MAVKILIASSVSTNTAPTTSNIAIGEMALTTGNTGNGRLYLRNTSNIIIELTVTGPPGPTGPIGPPGPYVPPPVGGIGA